MSKHNNFVMMQDKTLTYRIETSVFYSKQVKSLLSMGKSQLPLVVDAFF